MNHNDLELLKIHARITALEGLVGTLMTALIQTKDGRQALASTLDHWVKSSDQMSFPGQSAEYSDLWAAEAQTALEGLVSFIKSHLNKDG
jgi:hypothetical protein